MEKAFTDSSLAEQLEENEGKNMEDALAYYGFLGKQLETKIEALKSVLKREHYVEPYTFNQPPSSASQEQKKSQGNAAQNQQQPV